MQSEPDILIVDKKLIDREREQNIITTQGFNVESVIIESSEELIELGEGVQGLIIAADVQMTRGVLENLTALKVVGRAGIGVDNIDLKAAADTGTTVVNVPEYCIEEVSTHALSLLLACLRGVPMYDREIRLEEWNWETGRPITRLSEQTVGVIGLGSIGRCFAQKVMALDANVIAHDPYIDQEVFDELGVTDVSFQGLLDQATAVSVHCPLTSETRGMLGRDEFIQMDSNAVLINTSRGPIIEQDSLVKALQSDEIRAAGLDVFETEPLGASKLRSLSNAVLTPHVGWYSESSREKLKIVVTEDVIGILSGEPPQNPVTPEQPW